MWKLVPDAVPEAFYRSVSISDKLIVHVHMPEIGLIFFSCAANHLKETVVYHQCFKVAAVALGNGSRSHKVEKQRI